MGRTLPFTVWADRQGIPDADRPAVRAESHQVGRACLRASDLGKSYGWGIHADAAGRLALHPCGSAEYDELASGRASDGTPVKVVRAMRAKR